MADTGSLIDFQEHIKQSQVPNYDISYEKKKISTKQTRDYQYSQPSSPRMIDFFNDADELHSDISFRSEENIDLEEEPEQIFQSIKMKDDIQPYIQTFTEIFSKGKDTAIHAPQIEPEGNEFENQFEDLSHQNNLDSIITYPKISDTQERQQVFDNFSGSHQKLIIQTEDELRILHKKTLRRQSGRPKSTKPVSSALGHLWRALKIKFKDSLVDCLRKAGKIELIKDVQALFQNAKESNQSRKQENKWYINLFKIFPLLPYLLEVMSQGNFNQMIQEMAAKNRETYRKARKPILGMIILQLNYSEFKQFRDTYINYQSKIDSIQSN